MIRRGDSSGGQRRRQQSRRRSAPAGAAAGGLASGGGSGLGLSIVQAIAAAHGGQATLESWPGRGTRVRIWLPSRTAT